jgi:dsDNA-specific endonuclease/ATPase MutS2
MTVRSLEIKLKLLEQANEQFGNQIKSLTDIIKEFDGLRKEVTELREDVDQLLERNHVLLDTLYMKVTAMDRQDRIINTLLEKLVDK